MQLYTSTSTPKSLFCASASHCSASPSHCSVSAVHCIESVNGFFLSSDSPVFKTCKCARVPVSGQVFLVCAGVRRQVIVVRRQVIVVSRQVIVVRRQFLVVRRQVIVVRRQTGFPRLLIPRRVLLWIPSPHLLLCLPLNFREGSTAGFRHHINLHINPTSTPTLAPHQPPLWPHINLHISPPSISISAPHLPPH